MTLTIVYAISAPVRAEPRIIPTFETGAAESMPVAIGIGDLIGYEEPGGQFVLVDGASGHVFARVNRYARPPHSIVQTDAGIYLAQDEDGDTPRVTDFYFPDGNAYITGYDRVGDGRYRVTAEHRFSGRLPNRQMNFARLMELPEPYRKTVSQNGQTLAVISIGPSDLSKKPYLYDGDIPFGYTAAWSPRKLEVWDILSGDRIWVQDAPPGLVAGLAVSGDGRYVAMLDYGVGDNRLYDGSADAETRPRPDIALLTLVDLQAQAKHEFLIPTRYEKGGNPNSSAAPKFLVEPEMLWIPPLTAQNIGDPVLFDLESLSVLPVDHPRAQKRAKVPLTAYLARLDLGLGTTPDGKPIVWDVAAHKPRREKVSTVPGYDEADRDTDRIWFRHADGRLSWQPRGGFDANALTKAFEAGRGDPVVPLTERYDIRHGYYKSLFGFGSKYARVDISRKGAPEPLTSIKTDMERITSLTVSRDEQTIILVATTGKTDRKLIIYDVASKKMREQRIDAPGPYSRLMYFSENEQHVAFLSDSTNTVVNVYTTGTMKRVARFPLHKGLGGHMRIFDETQIFTTQTANGQIAMYSLKPESLGRLIAYKPLYSDPETDGEGSGQDAAWLLEGKQTVTVFCKGQTKPGAQAGNELLAGVEEVPASTLTGVCP